ncbi:MAG: hypothetical protein IH991_12825 [Planctomycetes bacterium]|nr:hypothetical protein [Planctomycetota bacterium]
MKEQEPVNIHTARRVDGSKCSPVQDEHAAIRLVESWLEDDSGYDEETWPEIKNALDRDRLSSRGLFSE